MPKTLHEDASGRLRCPECNAYFWSLPQHVRQRHKHLLKNNGEYSAQHLRHKWRLPACCPLEGKDWAAWEYEIIEGHAYLVLRRATPNDPTEECPFCGRHHSHGHDDGHRAPHCGNTKREYIIHPRGMVELRRSDGYIVRTVAQTRRSFPATHAVIHNQEESILMRPYLKMYIDGDKAAITTNLLDERELIYHASAGLGDVVAGHSMGVSEASALFLPLVVDLCCKLRGYKAPDVSEERVLFAGRIQPGEAAVVANTGSGTTVAFVPPPVVAVAD